MFFFVFSFSFVFFSFSTTWVTVGSIYTSLSCCGSSLWSEVGLGFAVIHASPVVVPFNSPSLVSFNATFLGEALKSFLLALADHSSSKSPKDFFHSVFKQLCMLAFFLAESKNYWTGLVFYKPISSCSLQCCMGLAYVFVRILTLVFCALYVFFFLIFLIFYSL